MSDSYTTIGAPSQAIVREKMSKFIALAYPVKSGAEAREMLRTVANEYCDARHVCWAYRIGAAGEEYQCNDNGEPSGTAGRPILGQIRSAGLTDVVVAVVRYFGGVKLGTSGLIAAYREVTRQALDAATKVTLRATQRVTLQYPYVSMNLVMKAVKGLDAKIISQTCDTLCHLCIDIAVDDLPKLQKLLGACAKIENGNHV